MLTRLKENKLIFTLLVILAVLLIIYILLPRKDGGLPILPPIIGVKTPKIVKVIPVPDSEDVPIETSLEVYFDKEVNEESLSYTVNPKLEFARTLSVDPKTLYLSPIPLLEPGTFYTITLTKGVSNIRTQNFEGSYTFSFKTSEELSESDEVALQSKYDEVFNRAADEYERTHPLLQLMPVEAALFSIDYKGGGLYEYNLNGVDKILAKEAMLLWWKQRDIDPQTLKLQESATD